MKKLLTILAILLCSIGFAQTKVQVIEGKVIRTGIPSKFERPNKQTVWGGYDELPDSIHYADGFRDLVYPTYDATTQRITNRHYDLVQDAVTYDVVDKTIEELQAEREAVLDAIENDMDILAMKRLLRILTADILQSDTVTSEQLADLATIYPQYRIGKTYIAGEVFALDSDLFKVIQAHTSQADWKPASTPALYGKFTPPGQVAQWVQPTGAHDAYNTGDRVLFNGKTYESLINANTWSPTAYPAGWVEITN